MTILLSSEKTARQIGEVLPQAGVSFTTNSISVKADQLLQVARFLKETQGLDFDYLVNITGVDYLDYIDVVYHLVSQKNNHSLVLKVTCPDRNNAVVPSVITLWRGADFLERETFDLVGVRFDGHPNMKRIYLWEGFQGHPLRRDYR